MSVTDAPAGHVLILDADAMNRRIISSTLAADGFHVAVAKDRRAALHLLAHESFDVVLLDLLLPSAGGLDVLEHLRGEHPDVPVIVLAAMDHTDRLLMCLALGAHDYLHKPVNPVLLRTRVRASLARQRLHAIEMAQPQPPDRDR